MTYFMKSGSRYRVSANADINIHEKLPVGTYTVKFNQMEGYFYLEEIDNFEIHGKVYGDTKKTATRILRTFADRVVSTGVMLSGEKGSGKTLLAKMLSLDAQAAAIPTIVINAPWCGEEFNSFIQLIDQPTVIIFDEFEKVYDKEDQEKMLTLLDGVYPSKKLFIITCNDKWRVNEHMRNRPGRIYYRLDYSGLTNDFIIEYCQDNLKDKAHIDAICRIATVFGSFNFDMLKAMVEEMNRYNESPHEVMEFLNTKPEFEEANEYSFTLQVEGKEVPREAFYRETWRGNPMNGPIVIEHLDGTKDSDGDDHWAHSRFEIKNLEHIDSSTGRFQFTNPKGEKLWLSKVEKTAFDWRAY